MGSHRVVHDLSDSAAAVPSFAQNLFLRFVCVDACSCLIESSCLTVPHLFRVRFNVNGHLDCFQSSVLMNNVL